MTRTSSSLGKILGRGEKTKAPLGIQGSSKRFVGSFGRQPAVLRYCLRKQSAATTRLGERDDSRGSAGCLKRFRAGAQGRSIQLGRQPFGRPSQRHRSSGVAISNRRLAAGFRTGFEILQFNCASARARPVFPTEPVGVARFVITD